MNREILFRGKAKQLKEWVYGFLLIGTTTRIATFYPNASEDENATFKTTEVIPDTVGQFTGLLDSKGNKIFEGDILQSEILPDFSELTIVCFQSGCFMIQWAHDREANLDLLGIINYKTGRPRKNEIVGNVFDNPELFTTTPPEKQSNKR